jgi:hypothetical protein
MAAKIGKLALLWRGDQKARETATPETSRFSRVFEALKSRGIDAEPAVYSEDNADEVRAQLRAVNGVLVWVDPLSNGQNRIKLDAMLRDIASAGIWISAHPDVILKMGVKEVLHRTKRLGWGVDTHLYRSAASFREGFPQRLRSDGPRVLKQNRGNGGQGVWKVEILSAPEGSVRVLQARRGSVPEELLLEEFVTRCDEYFPNDGCIVDQPFQPRLPDGMIRCYMSGDRVVGFGHQLIKALIAPPPEGPDAPSAQPGPRIMYPRSTPQFQRLQMRMETEWVPQMTELLEINRKALPLIWDADFLYGPRTDADEDTYVLCEINVNSVFPIPDEAPEEIARSAEARLKGD